MDVLEAYYGLFNSTPWHTRFDSFIADNFDTLAYTNNNDNVVKSALGRMRNAMVIALNENNKLPKYVLVVMENDIIRCIKFNKPGLIDIYGAALHWLLNEYHEAIIARKGMLPPKAVKYMYPQVFIVALPQHKNFKENQNRYCFNQCIEELAKNYKEFKVLRMKRRWTYEDPNLVDVNGCIMEEGRLTYWAAIDEALQFWETGKKKSFSEQQFVRQILGDHKNCNSSRERQNYRSNTGGRGCDDKPDWNRGERKLPRPPPK